MVNQIIEGVKARAAIPIGLLKGNGIKKGNEIKEKTCKQLKTDLTRKQILRSD